MAKDLLGADYYSLESDWAYWSVSQVKKFLDCEARAVALLQQEWSEKRDNTALLVGNMVHSYFESQEAHEEYMVQNQEAMVAKTGKTKGQLKTDFLVGKRMIERLKADKSFMAIYQGQKELAVSGQISGIPFKGKIDCLNLERGYFVDIKTTKAGTMDEVWTTDRDTGRNEKKIWFEAYGYVLQMAVYQELLRQTYGKEILPVIYAVTKEEPSDTLEIQFRTQEVLDYELRFLKTIIKRLDDVKHGRIEPIACQKCDYCRATNKTRRVLVY